MKEGVKFQGGTNDQEAHNNNQEENSMIGGVASGATVDGKKGSASENESFVEDLVYDFMNLSIMFHIKQQISKLTLPLPPATLHPLKLSKPSPNPSHNPPHNHQGKKSSFCSKCNAVFFLVDFW